MSVAVSFQDFHRTYVITIHQCHGQRVQRTDRSTGDMRSQDRALYYSDRAVISTRLPKLLKNRTCIFLWLRCSFVRFDRHSHKKHSLICSCFWCPTCRPQSIIWLYASVGNYRSLWCIRASIISRNNVDRTTAQLRTQILFVMSSAASR